jgi:hypothetical protein
MQYRDLPGLRRLGSRPQLQVARCYDGVLLANDSIDIELVKRMEDKPCATANICDS